MSQDDQQLSKLRAAFAAPAAAPNPESCPAPETIWAAVRGELPPRELREVVDHTAVCAACAEDWRLAAELIRESSAAPAAVPGKVLQGRFGRWRPLTAAAALAAGLLIAVGIYRLGDFGPKQPTYREAESTAIRSLMPADQPLPRQGAVLRWSPVAGAESYDVRVSTEDLRLVLTAESRKEPSYAIPESALSSLAPGTKLLWQVDAVLPDGSRRSSPTFSAVVR
ncbi:MAG TPA: zf-HC2 domain-containing protein [Thermoanaerobaculia bacterium]|jgi:bacterioferritin-associated ferredoxin|nr:zf-HC2 domain-containing protein [Thermoanaerobaculia bacterium]